MFEVINNIIFFLFRADWSFPVSRVIFENVSPKGILALIRPGRKRTLHVDGINECSGSDIFRPSVKKHADDTRIFNYIWI